MPTRLLIAPAGAGKTQACIDRAQAAARERPLAPVWICLPSRVQVRACRERLAAAGGALGVEVGTFFDLYRTTLRAAGVAQGELAEPLQHRLLRAVVDEAAAAGDLRYYLPLRDRPGFIVALHGLVEELKQARVEALRLSSAVHGHGPRLEELARIYASYQRWLRERQWMDQQGLGWLAALALGDRPGLLGRWSFVAVDGFDQLNQTQKEFLAGLARQVPELWVTLTYGPTPGRLAQRRFEQTLAHLEASLGLAPGPLPCPGAHPSRADRVSPLTAGAAEPGAHARPPAGDAESGLVGAKHLPTGTVRAATKRWQMLRPYSALSAVDDRSRCELSAVERSRREGPLGELEALLFERARAASAPGEAIAWVEAPNRAVEVRAALRWVKERLVQGGLACSDLAILARDIGAYAPLLAETAAEFGIPLCLVEGQPISGNPAVAALLALLSLPRRDRASASLEDGRFPLRQTLEALRSPYFDWQRCEPDGEPLGLDAEQVDRLEQAARAVQVVGGVEQWREALRLAQLRQPADEETGDGATGQPVSREEWRACEVRFERLVARLTPPAESTVARFTSFVEDLMGEGPSTGGEGEAGDSSSLRMLARVAEGPSDLARRDVAALRAVKDALRALVWVEAALGRGERVTYERFLDDLAGVIAAGTYDPAEGCAGVLAASAPTARGLSFRAVALLGLSEGDFPRAPAVDPLLREADRAHLVAQRLPMGPPPGGAEFTLFYEAVTRAREQLLLCRPYLGDDGQPRAPSPFWEETLRLFGADSQAAAARLVSRVRSLDPLPPERACSWPEYVAHLGRAVRAHGARGSAEVAQGLTAQPEAALLWGHAAHGARVLAGRLQRTAAGPHEGDLSALAPALAAQYADTRPWTASRLETYLGCPFSFFLAYVLDLKERPPEEAGFDAAQLGTMYHEVLERVCRRVPGGALPALLAELPAVAEEVFTEAPRKGGFRPGPLWEQEKARIRQDLANTLRALGAEGEGWQPLALELAFGTGGSTLPAQPVRAGAEGTFLLRGIIDRVDRNPLGQLRLIDYKSSASPIRAEDLLEGHRVQLALYAAVAPQLVGAGAVADGFYWHIRAARRSSLCLGGFEGGVPAAVQQAAAHAWRAVSGARQGAFAPRPGPEGCPPYCLGREFCWRYAPRQWGRAG